MIKCYIGCMFSGKTSAMLNDIEKANIAGLKTLVIKFKGDNRYCNDNENKIVTHSKRDYSYSTIVSTSNLKDIDGVVQSENIDVIGIDEFQFMNNPEIVLNWLNEQRDIFISSLDGDYKQKVFENVSYIIPYCYDVVKLRAVCMKCHKRDSAIYSKRISDDQERVVIGGSDKYIAVCKDCLN